MNPVVAEVIEKQIKSLKWIYGVMVFTVLGTFAVTLLLGAPAGPGGDSGILLWTQLGLGAFGAVLLGLILPITRARLLDPVRVKNAPEDKLAAWGLPKSIDPQIGRQAVYLTRYTAGCVISWGLAAACGLYGLVARMLGSSPLTAGLVLLPPRGQWLRETVERI